MTPTEWFIKKSVIAYSNKLWGSGDRYVLLEDVLKFMATLEKHGITVDIGDDENQKEDMCNGKSKT